MSSCIACTPGKYCSTQGLSAPSGSCAPGFYCLAGSVSANSIVCPEGFFCPEGASSPLGCPDATYQLALGSSSCLDCSAGYYCQGNSTKMTPCPVGFYCPPKSSAPISCPPGTISPARAMLTTKLDCIPWCDVFIFVSDEILICVCSLFYCFILLLKLRSTQSFCHNLPFVSVILANIALVMALLEIAAQVTHATLEFQCLIPVLDYWIH
jgi:hypothetical protein